MAATEITDEQWAISESYIAKIKEDNANFAVKNGRSRLAHTETYGCQQNVNDTERIRGMLDRAGFGLTDDANDADLVIYNTCASAFCAASASLYAFISSLSCIISPNSLVLSNIVISLPPVFDLLSSIVRHALFLH